MAENLVFKRIINDIKDTRKLKQVEVAKMLDVTNPYLSSVMNGKYPLTENLIDKLYEIFNIKLNIDNSTEEDDVTPIDFKYQIPVKVVSHSARAGFSESYYADEYLDDMPTILIEADKEYKGRYIAFEVNGDSMEPDYLPGDVVICREVPRNNWQYKLHINEWDFVIAHGTQGIMLKEITEHDVETGNITCHSINTEMHPDFTLNLREVAFLYNVVEHRRQARGKNRISDRS